MDNNTRPPNHRTSVLTGGLHILKFSTADTPEKINACLSVLYPEDVLELEKVFIQTLTTLIQKNERS